MAARTKGKITPKYKTKYRVKNWAEYEASLRKNGHFVPSSRRSATVEIPTVVRHQNGPIHLVNDSTGLKIMGETRVACPQAPDIQHAARLAQAPPRRGREGLHRRLGANRQRCRRRIHRRCHARSDQRGDRIASPSKPAENVLQQRDAAIARIGEIGRRF